jgi:acyl-CoA synthetase (AMP-forming)/AMP-acid ligase II
MTNFRSLVDLLARNCREGDRGITHIYGARDEVFVSYRDLWTRAQRALGALQAMGMEKGDELIFQVADNQPFLELFWACLMGGMIAVPISIGNNDERKLKVFKIWQVLNRPQLVAEAAALRDLEAFAVANGLTDAFDVIKSRSIDLERVRQWDREGILAAAEPGDIAYLQFSSGSTGDPKGVTLTHENLLVYAHQFCTTTQVTDGDSFFGWMPLTHDLGLIGWHLMPLSANLNHYLMPPRLFVADPTLWLEKAAEHKATVLASPNFGYKLLLDHFQIETCGHWDLSHIRLIINGAEPISPDLCDMFLETLQPLGLKRTAMYNIWGLAEACLVVSFPPVGESFVTWCVDRESLAMGQTVRELPDRNHKNAVLFADVGLAGLDMGLRIADDEGRPIGDMVVGHIQVSGRNVTQGYYNNPEATARVMTADGWLDTGDVGFMRNGRLVITGRAKEVIFVNGQNYYPHDIERVLEPLGLQLGKVIACGVHNDVVKRDEIVVFVQHKQGLAEFVPLALAVKRCVMEKMGLVVGDVVPIPFVPKTTSGKYQRVKLRDRYCAGEYDAVLAEVRRLMAEAAPAGVAGPLTETEQTLLALVHEVFENSDLGVHDNLSYHGANSLRVTKLHARIESLFPGRTTLSTLYSHLTVAKLAEFIEQGGSISVPAVELPAAFRALGGRDSGQVALELTVDGARHQQLMALAAAEQCEPSVLLLSVFAHLLSEVTGQARIAVQALIGPVADRIVSVEPDLGAITDLAGLLQFVADTCSARRPAVAYVVPELGKVSLSRTGTAVLPLFYDKAFLTSGARFMDVYDLTLQVTYSDAMVTCLCEFGADRLNKEQVRILLGQYSQLLDQLVAQYAEADAIATGSHRE